MRTLSATIFNRSLPIMVTKRSSGKSPERRNSQAVVRADSSKPLILVVEDHQDTRDLLKYMLTSRNWIAFWQNISC